MNQYKNFYYYSSKICNPIPKPRSTTDAIWLSLVIKTYSDAVEGTSNSSSSSGKKNESTCCHNCFPSLSTLIKRTLLFCNIKLQHYGFETGKTNLSVKVLLNSINIPKVGNSKAMKLEEDILEQCIQQYVLEQFPTDGIEDDKIIKQLQEKIETHPYANAIWCSWGYAGTCHTSQGSEWEYVVADLNYAENFDSSWVYTALTRSQKTLCILNPGAALEGL